MFHHFLSINIDLDEERKPCLQLHVHKAEMLIKEVEIIIFAFAVYGIKGKPPIVMFFRLEGLAVFYNGEDADKPLIYRMLLQSP